MLLQEKLLSLNAFLGHLQPFTAEQEKHARRESSWRDRVLVFTTILDMDNTVTARKTMDSWMVDTLLDILLQEDSLWQQYQGGNLASEVGLACALHQRVDPSSWIRSLGSAPLDQNNGGIEESIILTIKFERGGY